VSSSNETMWIDKLSQDMCNVTHSYWCFDSFVTWYTHTHKTHLILAEICRLRFFDVFQISRGNLLLFCIILELYVDLYKRTKKS